MSVASRSTVAVDVEGGLEAASATVASANAVRESSAWRYVFSRLASAAQLACCAALKALVSSSLIAT
jgi:hypothetical protein